MEAYKCAGLEKFRCSGCGWTTYLPVGTKPTHCEGCGMLFPDEDLVKVTRCGKCKFGADYGNTSYVHCMMSIQMHSREFYCAAGTPRTPE